MECREGDYSGAELVLREGVSVGAQPSVDIYYALEKVQRVLRMVGGAGEDGDDKENILWNDPSVSERRKVNPSQRPALAVKSVECDAIVPHDLLGSDAVVSMQPSMSRSASTIALQQPSTQPVMPPKTQTTIIPTIPSRLQQTLQSIDSEKSADPSRPQPISLSQILPRKKDPTRRKNLGRRLGPPLRASVSSVDSNGSPTNLPISPNTKNESSSDKIITSKEETAVNSTLQTPDTTPPPLPRALIIDKTPPLQTIAKQPIVKVSVVMPEQPNTAIDKANRQTPPNPPLQTEIQSQPPNNLNPKKIITINGTKYTKHSQIGAGGSSKVYLVHSQSGLPFALKRVKLGRLDGGTISGLKNEVELLKRLKGDDRIVRMEDSEINEVEVKILLEWGEGDLAGVLESGGSKGMERVYWEQMLRAVKVIHAEGIIHSDLKPANFLVVKGVLKLIDFGIAGCVGDGTTNVHRDYQSGTINYMSPESLTPSTPHDFKLGKSSDVWSLGCILYQIVYKSAPFAHITNFGLKCASICNPSHRIQYPRVSEGIGGGSIDVMKRCLKFKAKDRDGIDELLSHEWVTGNIACTSSQEENGARVRKMLGYPGDINDWGEVLMGIYACLEKDFGRGVGESEEGVRRVVQGFLNRACRGSL